MIDSVKVAELTSFPDERGFFREVIRFDDFGFEPKQESHAFRVAGVSNGWHIHRFHRETFYVVRGMMRLCLKDCRCSPGMVKVSYPYDGIAEKYIEFGYSSTALEYQEFVLSEYFPQVVSVPAGVAHGYRILQDCDIIYTATATYDTSQHDEGRIPWNFWPEHCWTRKIETK